MTTQAHPMTRKRLIAPTPDLPIERFPFHYRGSASDPLPATLYRAEAPRGAARLPAVILVSGYPDPGFEARFGCAQPAMASYVSWAELLVASGMAAVTYRNEHPDDAAALLNRLRDDAPSLGIDRDRVGLWSCSGNVPNALSLLMTYPPPALRCAALCYGYLLDLDAHSAVADAASTWGFANPAAGKSLADLPDVPLLVVRAADDAMPGLNATIDRFVAAAVAQNRAVSFVNVAHAPHAFDLELDSAASRAAIRQIVDFLVVHLSA